MSGTAWKLDQMPVHRCGISRDERDSVEARSTFPTRSAWRYPAWAGRRGSQVPGVYRQCISRESGTAWKHDGRGSHPDRPWSISRDVRDGVEEPREDHGRFCFPAGISRDERDGVEVSPDGPSARPEFIYPA